VGIAPLNLSDERLGIRIHQQLVGIKAVTLLWPVSSMNAIPVQEIRLRLWQISVPNVLGPRFKLHALQLVLATRIEQAEFHPIGIRRKQGEVDSVRV
jgi:hypothetical protein